LTSAAAENNAKNGKRYDDSALMTAAHILIDLTQEGKIIKDAANDFDNNFELVSVWIDYMIGIN
jgi:hypothetical protein